MSGWARRGSSEQGRFLAALAQAGGDLLIDMNGPVAPPACGEEVTRKKIRTYVKGRPGVVHELSDVTAGGETAIYHVVDASFLLAWLKDPDFHLPN